MYENTKEIVKQTVEEILGEQQTEQETTELIARVEKLEHWNDFYGIAIGISLGAVILLTVAMVITVKDLLAIEEVFDDE